MSPYLSSLNATNCALPDSVVCSDYYLSARICTNSDDVGFGQFGLWVQFTAAVFMATLYHLVGHVVQVGAEKQMVRIDACADIASMKNAHPVISSALWNRSIRQLPSDSLSRLQFPVESKMTVSAAAERSCPQPAFAGLVNLRPESLFLYALRSHMTSLGSVVRDAAWLQDHAASRYFTPVVA